MDIFIRRARPDEIGWVNERYQEIDFAPSHYDQEVIAIVEVSGERVGLGRLVKIDANNLELGGMFVFEQFRKAGIARTIVNFLLEQAKPFETIFCVACSHLSPFYESFGFKACTDIPEAIAKKYHWCKEHYEQGITLLCLR